MATIIIVDDHDLIREGIKTLLRNHAEYRIIGEADNGDEALAKTRQLKPDVLLLDISMSQRSGLDILDQVRQSSPTTKVIMITVHRSPLYLKKALKSGAKGYLHKENAAEELLPALKRVTTGGTYLSAMVSEYLSEQVAQEDAQDSRPPEATLTERETDIVRLVVDGKTAREIADQLFISPRTVENHKQAILKKLSLRKTSDLIKYALTHRIVDLDQS